eukprot:13356991-Heterocapsa_arctica.AAC.1
MSLGQTLLHLDLPTASFIPQLGCSRDTTGRRIRGYTLTRRTSPIGASTSIAAGRTRCCPA